MKTRNLFLLMVLLVGVVLFGSCKKDEKTIGKEEEIFSPD